MRLILIILILLALYKFFMDRSYEFALEAKFYFLMNDFNNSLFFAKKALKEDKYNRLAISIMTQSKASLKYQEYINEAKKRLNQIIALSKEGKKNKIKFIAKLMIDEFKFLPKVGAKEELVREAKRMKDEFERLLRKIDEKVNL